METAELTKTKWTIDPSHSEIGFKVKHLIVATVRGSFKEFESSIYTTGDDFMSVEIDVTINAASITTGDEKRDEHLRSPDFFDTATHGEINFMGNTYEKDAASDQYKLTGDLSMKGVTKRIALNVDFCGIVKDPWGNDRAVFSINGKINRKDWGLTWNTTLDTGALLVSDEVVISCEIQLLKSTAQ